MKKAALSIFSCHSPVARNSSKNFLTFSFHPFTTLLWNLKAIPSTSTKLFSLNKGTPQKTSLSLDKGGSYKISLLEMLKRPGVANFADIINIAITLSKKTINNSIKVKRITNYVSKRNFIFISQYNRYC